MGQQIAGIEVSHPNKVLFPELGITKKDLVDYYAKMSQYILPYLKDRPLTLQRFPDGINEQGFYQKNASDYFPDFIEQIEIKTKEGVNHQVICNDKQTLVYLANQATITFHTWLSRRDKIDHPDKVIFDLDPPEDSFEKVTEAAEILHAYLSQKDIDAQLMTTGKNGLHVYYSIRRTKDFEELRKEIRTEAEVLAQKHPKLLTTEIRKTKRKGRIFLDYLRNAYGQTSVCPYSLRPTAKAGVATPIEWDELSQLKSADQYNYQNIFRRLAQKDG